jgi:hypothetical protein
MAKAKRSRKNVQVTAEPKVKPVRLDLVPAVHKALRREAAELDLSMAALARRVISERYGFTEDGEKAG